MMILISIKERVSYPLVDSLTYKSSGLDAQVVL